MEYPMNTGTFKVGDLVVGSSDPNKATYSANGAKINSNGATIYGNDGDLQQLGEDFVKSMTRHGGVKMVDKPGQSSRPVSKKGIKKKLSSVSNHKSVAHKDEEYAVYSSPEPAAPPQVVLHVVQFENDFGKIKAKVEYVVETDLAFMLIFSDEDAMVFEPKIGETLTLHTPDKYRHDVYYPGVTFDSPVDNKRFMILFKLPEENQE